MGVVFSLFMLSSMAGAAALGLLGRHAAGRRQSSRTSDCLPPLFLLGTLSLITPVVTDFKFYPTIIAFVIFEATAGFYWPAMAAVKGHVVADECRANVYNLYRVPLNAIVVGVLLTNPSLRVSFLAQAALLGLASVVSFVVAIALRRRENALMDIAPALCPQGDDR